MVDVIEKQKIYKLKNLQNDKTYDIVLDKQSSKGVVCISKLPSIICNASQLFSRVYFLRTHFLLNHSKQY